MKVLLVYPSSSFSTFDVAAGIQEGLEQEGHEVVPYRLYQRMYLMHQALATMVPRGHVPALEEVSLHASEGLVQRAITEECPWVLVITGSGLHPNALLALRRVGVRVAVWFTEAPYDSNEEKELYLARFCDLAFINERTSVMPFQRVLDSVGAGGRAAYLPHAYRPSLHRPWKEGDPAVEPSDVLLVGTGFVERQQLMEAIDWGGIDLRLGGMWPGIQSPSHLAGHVRDGCIDNTDTARLARGAKIVLNPHRFAAGAESANPRTYEMAACGAFQIADYRAEIAEVFGDSVPTFDPGVPWQLEALIRGFLANDSYRLELAREARGRVAPHTFAARARTIVEAIDAAGSETPRRLVAMPVIAG